MNDLPIDGVMSMNASFVTATNSPTNFAGQTGSGVNVPPLDADDVFVDFGAGSGGFGTAVLPFGTLQEAIEAANANATIHLEPGTTADTFSGAAAISKALTLLNKFPGGGSVQIGTSAKRSEVRSGFRSRPIASRSTRSGAP